MCVWIYHKNDTGGCCLATATVARWRLRTYPLVPRVMFTQLAHSMRFGARVAWRSMISVSAWRLLGY